MGTASAAWSASSSSLATASTLNAFTVSFIPFCSSACSSATASLISSGACVRSPSEAVSSFAATRLVSPSSVDSCTKCWTRSA